MKIDSSTIGMESARSYKASKFTVRSFSIKEYQGNLAQSGNALNAAVQDSDEGAQEQSEKTTQEQDVAASREWQRFGISSSRMNIRSTSDNTFLDIRQRTVRYIFDLLFGGRRSSFRDWMDSGNWSDPAAQSIQNSGTSFTTSYKVLNYTEETMQAEAEDTTFSTVGTVRTSDGREINFNVNVGMSRRFEQQYQNELQTQAFTLCDPLVINLDTDVAQLSDQTFYFDIDADGELDEISNLGSGSGYLALDKNNDGVINDGNELFGTSSGNGFGDLAKYDDDGNGWIDENDDIWSKLKIWTKDENGKDVLYSLADKGVGAICLQNAATDFTLTGNTGQTQGVIRNTGVFLYENGNVGTVQHVDVAKYSKQA
ncbi:MAG: hypothetical protein NC417_00130 [Candidatus Gastranaerophilales bacterium]|nr:hypothetical protein [Candidatus Gastranaerophilales bacterium]